MAKKSTFSRVIEVVNNKTEKVTDYWLTDNTMNALFVEASEITTSNGILCLDFNSETVKLENGCLYGAQKCDDVHWQVFETSGYKYYHTSLKNKDCKVL